MKYISKELIDWAVNKIDTEYKDDVSLLIGHKHWKIEPDGEEIAFNFFIPETEYGYRLAKTFIIEDIGYDLFPMSWERVEGLANLNESIVTCLADGFILYARSEEDRQRFIELQNKFNDNLKNNAFTYKKGLEKINVAMELYKNMIFEESLSLVRKASGYIAAYLSEAVAYVNEAYFKRGPENQIEVLSSMKNIPEKFLALYQGIIEAKNLKETKELCYEIIAVTREFFMERKPQTVTKTREYNFEDLAAWYEEGRYTFRRIYYYCDKKDVFNAFAWGYNFQQEFDSIKEEFGLKTMDLMGIFDYENLMGFRKCAEEIEEYIVSVIKSNEVKIREYSSLEEFLKVNR
ncbi:hypothetical protein JK636_00070 [Clostridium sp. YIM B02515]|uniref:Uncharacterized protein n=1 Tax=Clostridium rhizosphaerae TaxID=2803861 RepID=A0ABS1T671_9CLOT|nr:hypothetical protein [Clostridium rhizosphaerae]MBL4934146.1 hypothetical protein [Clostridium rhizosphaerae]